MSYEDSDEGAWFWRDYGSGSRVVSRGVLNESQDQVLWI